MHDAETRALRRAVILLLLVSAARWSWGRVQAGAPAEGGGSVLETLTVAVDEAVQEEQQRSRPLADGERIDPNRADEVELDRLPGVGPALAQAIVHARREGLIFRSPEDLEAVRGVGPALVTRLGPLLDLRRPPRGSLPRRGRSEAVDLNRAGAPDLQRLPGIGPALAERIIQHRREHLFTHVDELLEVRGIGPAVLERLRPLVTVR